MCFSTPPHLPDLMEKCKALQEQTCGSPSSRIACSAAVKPISNVRRSFYRDICFLRPTGLAGRGEQSAVPVLYSLLSARNSEQHTTDASIPALLVKQHCVVLDFLHVPGAKNSFAMQNFPVGSINRCRRGYYLVVSHRLKH